MKKLFSFLLISLVIIIIASCTAKQPTSPSATPPQQNYYVPSTGNIETAYPYAVENGPTSNIYSGIETAYPMLEADITPLPAGVLPSAPQEAPVPDAGKASISGILYLFSKHQVLPERDFFLLPSSGTTTPENLPDDFVPDPAQGDIIGRSDEYGNIKLSNVPPGKYYLLISNLVNWSLAQVSDQDATPVVLDLLEDSSNPLGIIYVSFPE